MNWRERLRRSFMFFAVGIFATLSLSLPLTLPNTAQADQHKEGRWPIFFYDPVGSSETKRQDKVHEFQLLSDRKGDSFRLSGRLIPCEQKLRGCFKYGVDRFRTTLHMEKDASSTENNDVWNIIGVTIRVGQYSGHVPLTGGRSYTLSRNGKEVYKIDYSEPSSYSKYQIHVNTKASSAVGGNYKPELYKNGRVEVSTSGDRKGNPVADFITHMIGENDGIPGNSYRLGEEGGSLFPKTLADYKEMFEKCVEKDKEKILSNVEIQDNGDSAPNIFISKQILGADCIFGAFPEVTLTLAAYEKWENGGRQGLVEFATSSIAISPAGWLFGKIADYFTDTRNAVRFIFISNTQPLVAVVDHEGDLEIFAYDVKTKELVSIAGKLSPTWKTNKIHARTGFYKVIANRVFMAPGCEDPVIYPNNNGGVYSKNDEIGDPVGCIDEGPNGWIAKWRLENPTKGGDCSMTWIFAPKFISGDTPRIVTELKITNPEGLNVISKGSICLYDWIITPIAAWLEDLIRYAGGVAYRFNYPIMLYA